MWLGRLTICLSFCNLIGGGVVYLSGDLPRACPAPNNFSIRKGYSVVTIYRDRSRT